MVRELMAHGVTLREQAAYCEIAPSSMGDLATGRSREPSGLAAVRLYFLHRGRIRKQAVIRGR